MVTFLQTKLDDSHSDILDAFSCGNDKNLKPLNHFIKKRALSQQKEFVGTTIILIDKKEKNMAGYMTLCADAINVEEQDKKKSLLELVKLKNNNYNTYPALKIGRLAVSEEYQKKGKHAGHHVGSQLFKMAVGYALKTNDFMGIRFIIVDSKKSSHEWYIKKLGFRILEPSKPDFLFYDILGWKNSE